MSVNTANMRLKDIRPAPCEIEYKNMKFLITDRPTDQNIHTYIQVWIVLGSNLCVFVSTTWNYDFARFFYLPYWNVFDRLLQSLSKASPLCFILSIYRVSGLEAYKNT